MDVTITKLAHACLLVETDGKRILIDPGVFTWNDERFDLSMVEGVDRILITHEHADHVHVDLVGAVLERSNDAQIETTASLQRILADQNMDSATSGTPQFTAPHERVPMGPGPQNTGFHVEGVLSHPGDSHSFVETMPILAMPFAAPWGSLVAGVDRTRLVRPTYVIPVHDWFLSVDGREFMYGLASAGFADDDIELLHIEDFTSTTLTV
ncbi:MAG: MBL fold metallo-hydrolase [Acidimicrobiia bacterium]|nr:MAG: MBL fold metallo-hydrolase [Acidimicrobiia bacterium]